ncbi:hypothetical protein [Streptomyces sp. NPDC086023]|uniref:hypothetical protein n=1 Tax=Streptomyces sp. NPDC086023 TaxID=3365746 RepID=UPI0037D1C7F0
MIQITEFRAVMNFALRRSHAFSSISGRDFLARFQTNGDQLTDESAFNAFSDQVYYALVGYQFQGGFYSANLLQGAQEFFAQRVQTDAYDDDVISPWFHGVAAVILDRGEKKGEGGPTIIHQVGDGQEQYLVVDPFEETRRLQEQEALAKKQLADARRRERDEAKKKRDGNEAAFRQERKGCKGYPGYDETLDARAMSILSTAGANNVTLDDIVVMPDATGLGVGGNPAIALMLPETIDTIRDVVMSTHYPKLVEGKNPHEVNIDVNGWLDRLKIGTIVIAASALDDDFGLGVMYHEAGHKVTGEKGECGMVFACELTLIERHLGRPFAVDWFTRVRQPGYLRQHGLSTQPGCDVFAEKLRKLLPEVHFYKEFKQVYEAATGKDLVLSEEAQQKFAEERAALALPEVGKTVTGKVPALLSFFPKCEKSQQSIKPAGSKKGDQVTFAGYTWLVENKTPSGEYTLKRLT